MDLFFRLTVWVIFLAVNVSSSFAAENKDLLVQADSLYQSKKFTEAFQIYEQLFEQNQGSPAMFAKMAFIREGLGDYANALYYLNLYYGKTSDRKALTKMRELAEKHGLMGYEYSDSIFITGIIKEYKYHLLLFLFSLSLMITAYIYRKKRRSERPVLSGAFQVIIIGLALVLINNVFIHDYGIVTHSNAVLMTGPSAGAEPVEIINKGHKLRLVHSDKVWSKVIWDDEEVYIRSVNLRNI